LLSIKILKPKQTKTGTADVPENLTANLTENPIKIHKNPAKSVKGEIVRSTSVANVKACKTISLQALTKARPTGLESANCGLERRWCAVVSPCSESKQWPQKVL
jgi:hypothetical protein